MKQKELDEPSLSMMSYASDEGGTEDKHQTDSQNYNDMDYDKMSVQYSPVKSTPMTMKNNCVNLRCMDNAQKLWTLREKYKKLEQNYFTLEKSGSRKYEEFEDLVKKKEKEQITLEIMTNIYENHLIKDLNLFELRNLETKILRSIDSIKDRKQRLFGQSTKSSKNLRVCIICYENEIKVLLKPCNHLCSCSSCSGKLETCPMCREVIISKENVKFSNNCFL